jgi:hypothetical protein
LLLLLFICVFFVVVFYLLVLCCFFNLLQQTNPTSFCTVVFKNLLPSVFNFILNEAEICCTKFVNLSLFTTMFPHKQ